MMDVKAAHRHGVSERLFSGLLCFLSSVAWAQEGSRASGDLAPVIVTGTLLGASDLVTPSEQISGGELLQRRQSTLGETLSGLPGVSSTYFGPNASRPVIRGQDGERTGVMSNGGASLDLSGLSADHAMVLDPLLIERVEVLRGPGALRFSGAAVGGVINVIDGRIQREALFDERGGVSGKVDAGYATGNKEQSGVVVLDGGNARYNLHVDVMSRRTDNVATPKALACTRNGVTTISRSICNSASDAQGAAVGGSLFFDRGYLGASMSGYGSEYGTTAEDEVSIRLRSNKLDLEGELRDLQGLFRSVKARYAQTDYRHTEYEAGLAATVFSTRGQSLGLEGRHSRMGRLDGVIGLQMEDSDFSAIGTETLAPPTRTRKGAVFVHEELATDWGKLSAATRVESVQVVSYGLPGESRFMPGSRNFAPLSLALGATWTVSPDWQLGGNLSSSERAPLQQELYADGEDVAVNARKTGNIHLDKERAINLDVETAWRRGPNHARFQLFRNEFSNYISLETTDAAASPPRYGYVQVHARFTGFEASGSTRLMDGRDTLDFGWRVDMVRADNTSTGQPLPRIAPFRIGSTVRWGRAAWSGRVGVERHGPQHRVPDGHQAVEGYTLWSASLALRSRLDGHPVLWYLRLDNATDTLAYSATSILTQTAPGKVPLPGRSLKAGLQLSF